MINLDALEKLGTFGGGALASFITYWGFLKKRARVREEVIEDGHISEIKRIRELETGCKEELQNVHDHYADRLQAIHEDYSKKLNGLRDTYNKLLADMLKQYDEVIKSNFELKVQNYKLTTELIPFRTASGEKK